MRASFAILLISEDFAKTHSDIPAHSYSDWRTHHFLSFVREVLFKIVTEMFEFLLFSIEVPGVSPSLECFTEKTKYADSRRIKTSFFFSFTRRHFKHVIFVVVEHTPILRSIFEESVNAMPVHSVQVHYLFTDTRHPKVFETWRIKHTSKIAFDCTEKSITHEAWLWADLLI